VLLTSLNLSIHFWPLGRRATDTSGLSSGGGGWGTQLYSLFSSGTPNRSYCDACCLQKWTFLINQSQSLIFSLITLSIHSSPSTRRQNRRSPAAARPTFDSQQMEILLLAVHALSYDKSLFRTNDSNNRANCTHAPTEKSNSAHRICAIDLVMNDSRMCILMLSHRYAIALHSDAVCVSARTESKVSSPVWKKEIEHYKSF
jgi:hypothetical protein